MKKLILLATLLTSLGAQASITCYTPRLSQKVVINDSTIALSKPYLQNTQRSVASTYSVRTRFKAQGFQKVVFIDGEKYTIHIEDKNNFSEINDFMSVRTAKGHEMTYPLTCE